ncbi:MAG: hypothetical protein AB8E15_10825 [Bdellovibrionales bacterium]
MRKLLLIGVTLIFCFSAHSGDLITDNTLSRIIKTELTKMNPKSNFLTNDIELSFSERMLNPFYSGFYRSGEVRELKIDSSSGYLNCTIHTKQYTSYQEQELSIVFEISFDHCDPDSNILVPEKAVSFLLNQLP